MCVGGSPTCMAYAGQDYCNGANQTVMGAPCGTPAGTGCSSCGDCSPNALCNFDGTTRTCQAQAGCPRPQCWLPANRPTTTETTALFQMLPIRLWSVHQSAEAPVPGPEVLAATALVATAASHSCARRPRPAALDTGPAHRHRLRQRSRIRGQDARRVGLDRWREDPLHPARYARRELLHREFQRECQDECLNDHWFLGLEDAKAEIED